MAHLERERVVRRQYILIVCLVLFFILGIFSQSVQLVYAQDPAAAETVSISGTKIWVDRNGNVLPEDDHPDSAKLSLFANGTEVETKTVSAADNWNWEFNDLPKYDDNGEEINYMVREASLDDYKSDMKIVVLNTYSPSKEITVRKEWVDAGENAGTRPESVTIRLLANGVPVRTMELNAGKRWSDTFTELPIMDSATEDEIVYSIEEKPVTGYTTVINGSPETGYVITNTSESPALENARLMSRRFSSTQPDTNVGVEELPGPQENADSSEGQETGSGNENTGQNSELENTPLSGQETENNTEEINQSPNRGETPQTDRNRENSGQETNRTASQEEGSGSSRRVSMGRIPESFSTVTELPGTGLTGRLSFHAKLNYVPLAMELEIPSLNVHSEIVKVPSAGGNFPVEGLGMEAGLLEGTALPGKGVSVLAAHNTLSSEEYGPFALIAALEEGERIFVRDADGSMMIFEVWSNAKIDASDVSGLFAAASEFEPSLTLLTCEDELLTGGYASRRIVSARKIN